MSIRLLSELDAEVYREIRLRALKGNAEAFGSTYEQEVARPLERFAERIEQTADQFTLGFFDDNESLVGVVGFKRENRLKTAHKGNVYGMYVAPEFRGRGVGKALLAAVIDRVSQECSGVEQIHLTVVSSNESAKRLYLSLGFEIYGVEPNALKFDGQYYDEDMMILRL